MGREEVSKRQGDLVADVASVLYGDGAWEYISKREFSDKTKRKLTAGLSAVGATAGAAGLGYAALKTGGAYRAARAGEAVARAVPKKGIPRHTLPKMSRKAAIGHAIKEEPVGSALVPLEVAGLGGEVMATKILHGDTKKKPTTSAAVKPPGAPSGLPSPGVTVNKPKRTVTVKSLENPANVREAKMHLVKLGVNSGIKAASKTPAAAAATKRAAVATGAATKKVVCKNAKHDLTFRGEISKMDTDKRQVFGWASIIEMDGRPVVDLQGDIMTIETVEKAAYDYVKGSRMGGRQHARDGNGPRQVSDMIESFLVTADKKEQMGLPDSVPIGWWVGFQVNDEDTWRDVKDQKLREFSIHGSGVRKELVVED